MCALAQQQALAAGILVSLQNGTRAMDRLAQTIDAMICEVAAVLWLVKAGYR